VLLHVSGRNVDVFRRSDATLVDGEYFTHLLYYRPWVWKFQVVQKAHAHVVFKVVTTDTEPPTNELEEIAAGSRRAMGSECKVDFEFVDDLPHVASGKFRYTISELHS
jgi:phenylacetate-CoA ligase